MSSGTQFAYRAQKAIGVESAAPLYEPLSGFVKPEGNLRCCCYSPDGRWFAWATPDDVKVVDANDGSLRTTLHATGVHEIGFSPKGSYIITWERPTKLDDGNSAKNLKVWKTETAEEVIAFVQKSQEGWNLQYTYDEKYCARIVTNTVQFFESHNMNTVWNRIHVEGVTDFALSPGKNYSIAVFIAERKGQPAIVRIYNLPNFSNHTSQKSFFKADKVQFKWNALGTAVLILAQTEVDKTGKSYYGETNLYLMTANGNFDCRVSLDKEGPVHDVAWSPNSREFSVVYGYMPAKTTIFDVRANVVQNLPMGPRNTISYSPQGRFILLGGFGNLQGHVDIFDTERNMNKITTIEASNATFCEWSPDGQHILTATTSPRLRVDNGVKIWHYTGPLMYVEALDELYNVCWRPQPPSLYPVGATLPSAPTPHASATAHTATHAPAKPAGAYRPPHARGSATPMHFKREDEGGAAHIFTNGATTSGSPSNGLNGIGRGRKKDVPGAVPADKTDGDESAGLSKAALKNKKKREAAKKAKEAAQQDPSAQTGSPQPGATSAGQLTVDGRAPPTGPASERQGRDGNGRNGRGARSRSRNNTASPRRGPEQGNRRSKSRNPDQSRLGGDNNRHQRGQSGDVRNHIPSGAAVANITPANNPAPKLSLANAPGLTLTMPTGAQGPLSPVPGTPSTTEDKRLRGLHKKLRAIEDLKMRMAGGEKLEDTQLKKIATEDQVRRELDMLGGV